MSVANASHSPGGGGPERDLVIGSGKRSSTPTTNFFYIHVNAQSDPAGENPRGYFVDRGFGGNGDVTGVVRCVVVRDNRALVQGLIKRYKTDPWQAFFMMVDDNGEGKHPTDKMLIALVNLSCPLQTLNGEGQQEADDLQLETSGRRE